MAIKGELKDQMSSSEFREYLAKKDRARTSKFGAVPTQTADGQKFKSTLEADFYNRQWIRLRAGEVEKIEREIRYELIVNGVYIASYYLDFIIYEKGGNVRYIDCKSQPTKTPLYLMKKQLMLALYEIEIEEVFA